MNKILFVLLISLLSINATNQNCKLGSGMTKGTIIESEYSDKKGKIKDRNRLTIIDRIENNRTQEITISMNNPDKKSKEDFSATMKILIDDTKLIMNMNFQSQQQMASMKDMKMTYQGDQIEYPCFAKVGDTFKNLNSTLSFGTEANPSIMKMSHKIMNRKVVGIEELIINGQSYPCTIYYNEFESKMLFTITGSMKQWFNIEYGVLKTETYDKKGNLEGTNAVVKIN